MNSRASERLDRAQMHIDRALRGIDELRRAISGRSQIQEHTNAQSQPTTLSQRRSDEYRTLCEAAHFGDEETG